MPNWCSTRYVCCGDPEEIQGLYDRMTRLAEMKEPLNPNGFGTTWLGNLVEDLGVDFQNMEEALVLVKEHNDDPDNENDNIWVHKFETVD